MEIKTYGSITITKVEDGKGIKKINTHLRTQPITTWKEDYAKRSWIKWDTTNGENNTHINIDDVAYIVGIATTANGDVEVSFYGVVTNVESSGVSMIPSHIITSGEKGAGGNSLQVKYLNSTTVPTITSNYVGDWKDEIQPLQPNERTYMTQRMSNVDKWSTPVQISAEDGEPGKDGSCTEYVYYRSEILLNNLSAPSYTNNTLTTGWTASPQGITEIYKYEYMSVRTKAAGSETWGGFSAPVIWSKWGDKGQDGDGTEYKYYLKNDTNKPTYSTVDTKWTDEPIGVSESNKYEYVIQMKMASSDIAKKIDTYDRSFFRTGAAGWEYYGAIGHIDKWTTGVQYNNSHISVGDYAYIEGKITGEDKSVKLYGKIEEVTELYVSMTTVDLVIGNDKKTFATSLSNVALWAKWGETGAQGPSGNSLQIKYINSADTPTITNNDVSRWSDNMPTVEAGKRLYMTQKMSNTTNWSAPVQMSAEDGVTPTVAIKNGYWVINNEETKIKAEGQDGKTPTITVGANGNWYIDGKDSGQKAQGEAGKDGSDIDFVYYLSQTAQPSLSAPTKNGTVLSNGWTESPSGISDVNKYEYMSVRTKPAGTNQWSSFSTPVIWSKWGEKGTDGDGVEYKYCLINSDTKPIYPTPSDQTYVWTDEPTGVSKDNKYEYVVSIVVSAIVSTAKKIKTVSRNFDKTNEWEYYGREGHEENWTVRDVEDLDNSHIYVGDYAYIEGTVKNSNPTQYAKIYGKVIELKNSSTSGGYIKMRSMLLVIGDYHAPSSNVALWAKWGEKGEDGDTPYVGTNGNWWIGTTDTGVKAEAKDGNSLQAKYINSATIPTITNNNVSAWSDTIPTPESGKRTYMIQRMSNATSWSSPIQISAEDGDTPTISISGGYWVINGETSSVKAEGQDGKTPAITVGSNGNWYIDGKDSGQKAQGEAGKDGSNIEFVYYRSATEKTSLTAPSYSGTTLTAGWTKSPQGITETYKYEYMSVRTKAAGSTTWSNFSTPVIWSKWGEKGQDGDGVEYKYYLSNSDIAPTYSASDTNWKDDPTGVSENNQYEYVVQITITKSNGTTTSTPSSVALWAKWSNDGNTPFIGENGNWWIGTADTGIKAEAKDGNSLQVKYINSATIPTITNNNVSGWLDAIPVVEAGKHTYMTQKLSNATNWSTPVQISAEDGVTPTVTISGGYWVINGETSSVKAEGKDGDTPVITVGSNGNWFINGSDSGQRAQGDAGKDGSCIEYVYYRSKTEQSGLTAPTYANDSLTAGWTASPQGITSEYKYEYMSMRTKPSGINTSWSNFSNPVIWSKWGEKGQDGDGVEYKYCLINSSTEPTYPTPDGQTYTWEDEPTGVSENNKYEYVVQIKTTTTNGIKTSTTSAVALWAKWGEKGRGTSGVTNYYYATAKDTDVLPDTYTGEGENTTPWKTKISELTNAFSETYKYLWNYEVVSYDDRTRGDPTDPAIIGVYSKDGKGINDVVEYYMVTTTSGVPNVVPTLEKSNGWTKDDGNTELPVATEDNPYLWNYEIIDYTEGTDTTSGPVCIGTYGNSIKSTIKYYTATESNEAPSRYAEIQELSVVEGREKRYTYDEVMSWVGRSYDDWEYIIIDNPVPGDICYIPIYITDRGNELGHMKCQIVVYHKDSLTLRVSSLSFNMGDPDLDITDINPYKWKTSVYEVGQSETTPYIWSFERTEYTINDPKDTEVILYTSAPGVKTVLYYATTDKFNAPQTPDELTEGHPIREHWTSDFPATWNSDTYFWTTTKEEWLDGTVECDPKPAHLISQMEAAQISARMSGQDIAEWCKSNNVTIIDGSTIVSNSITANQINTEGLQSEYIQSKNYSSGVPDYLVFTPREDGGTYKVGLVEGVSDEEIIIPETYNGKPVVEIDKDSFANGKDIIKILAIPATVTTIPFGFLEGYTMLEELHIPVHNELFEEAYGVYFVNWFGMKDYESGGTPPPTSLLSVFLLGQDGNNTVPEDYFDLDIQTGGGFNVYLTPTITGLHTNAFLHSGAIITPVYHYGQFAQTSYNSKTFQEAPEPYVFPQLDDAIVSGFKISSIDGEPMVNSPYFKVSQDGEIEAARGDIAGWQITEDALYKSVNGVSSGMSSVCSDYDIESMVGGNSSPRFFAGSNSSIPTSKDDAKFLVLDDGSLYASAADVSGNVRAKEGEIGGFNIKNKLLNVNNNVFGVYTGEISDDDTSNYLMPSVLNAGYSSVARIYAGTSSSYEKSGRLEKTGVAITNPAYAERNFDDTYDLTDTIGDNGKLIDVGVYAYADYTLTRNLDNYNLTVNTVASSSYTWEYTKDLYLSYEDYTVDVTGSFFVNYNGSATYPKVSFRKSVTFDSSEGKYKYSILIYGDATLRPSTVSLYNVTITLSRGLQADCSFNIESNNTVNISGTVNVNDHINSHTSIIGCTARVVPKYNIRYSYISGDLFLPVKECGAAILSDGSMYANAMKVNKKLCVGDDNCITVNENGEAKLSGTWLGTSDQAILSWRGSKYDIEPLTNKYSVLFDNLNPSRFKYLDGESGRYHIGFVLDELKSAMDIAGLDSSEVAAYCVSDETTGEGGIRYGEFVALNTMEIQKLKSRVSELEEKNAKLEARLAKIESMLNVNN